MAPSLPKSGSDSLGARSKSCHEGAMPPRRDVVAEKGWSGLALGVNFMYGLSPMRDDDNDACPAERKAEVLGDIVGDMLR